MQNDLTYLRFHWDRIEDEVLPDDIIVDALSHLGEAFRQATKTFVGRPIGIQISRVGPPRRYCIEIVLAAQILDVGVQAIALTAQAPRAAQRFADWANDYEGAITVCGFIWQALCGVTFWQIVQKMRKPRLPIEPTGMPSEQVIIIQLSEALAADQNTRRTMSSFMRTALRSGASRIEIQYRGEPSAEILPAKRTAGQARKRRTR